MIRLWCWLFWSCAAPTPAPAPVPPPEPPPAAAAEAPPAATDAGQPLPAATADRAAPTPPEAPPMSPSPVSPAPEPPARVALALAPPSSPKSQPTAPAAPEPPGTPPAWRRFAVAAAAATGRPTLSVVIDDMGVNVAQSLRAVALPGPLTLSWMPYAPQLATQVATGTAHGHETMLHMPMEALGRAYPGPGALRTWLPPAANLANLRAALDAVPTAVALNQHEGSVASLSVPLMDLVMGELKARNLAFLDSLTIPHSVALTRAEAVGLAAVARDVFIDNDPNPVAIHARLAEAEDVARRKGHAVLIGHARQTTMDVLEQYLPTVPARGFVLWPLSAAIAAEAHVQLGAATAGATPGSAIGATASAGDVAVAPARRSGAE